VYVDGETELAALRALESHLVGCERCRRRVLGLRAEARLLRRVLRGEPPETPAEAASEASGAAARGLWLGLAASLVTGALAMAGAGLLLGDGLPAGLAWLQPLRLLGVNEMLFDVVFALRDRAPGLVEFALAVGVTAALAGLVTTAAGALLRRFTGATALGLVLLLGLPAAPARAGLDVRHDESVHVVEGETLAATLVVSGDTVRIDGVLAGHLVVFAERLVIHGRVEGSVFGFVRDVEVDGTVTGDLHVGAEETRIEGEIGGSLAAAGDRVALGRDGRVGRDLWLFGEDGRIEGRVGRDLVAMAEWVDLGGEVGRDVDLWVEGASVGSGAAVGGTLVARADDPERVQVASGARIAGAVDLREMAPIRHGAFHEYGQPVFYLWVAARAVAALLVGLALWAVWPALFAGSLASAREFFGALGVGFAALVGVPLVLGAAALTVIGIPLALIGAAVYVTAVYLSGIAVAALIGRSLVDSGSGSARGFALCLAAGVAVVMGVTNLPLLGGLARGVIVLVGLGMLVERVQQAWRARGAAGGL